MQSANGHPPCIIGIIQRGHQHLHRSLLCRRRGDLLQDGIQKERNILLRLIPFRAHPIVLGGTVDHWKVQLLFTGIQRKHQIEYLLIGEIWFAVGLVHFIDDDNGLESELECFLKNKACLRHGALKGIHQQKNTVGHIQHALHLPSKVRVARCIDQIDLHPFVSDRDVLAQDGDAPFTLEIVVVENELSCLLILTKEFAIMKDLIDQSGLAVIDVGDDGDVA